MDEYVVLPNSVPPSARRTWFRRLCFAILRFFGHNDLLTYRQYWLGVHPGRIQKNNEKLAQLPRWNRRRIFGQLANWCAAHMPKLTFTVVIATFLLQDLGKEFLGWLLIISPFILAGFIGALVSHFWWK
jgi:hypothetical protein